MEDLMINRIVNGGREVWFGKWSSSLNRHHRYRNK